ncbi:succinic semialdehyde dehydrogenase [Corynebacterium sanguinis]|uniref:Aldehyde dehydrogenase n=1 Tax=Corynebacterium sanguinis TaxID=2594913 RepID=A0A6C1TUK6_9CORY|nr:MULTISPECIES: succinic semialdehyde dehydrogenase [Corynebacterium]MBA4503982.1 succinate-semialdehyde dehydrogenase (NADP(+)) [Corynebacterium sanguinis]MCT1413407.1 succinic semialdehyde dehydrogenase [Corynebacterium sanguinis]MCT1464260.1 succinic semialdehyde dehydrogenase [Corynebacterium sanguinis]MCT1498524.1 succinic semialdehyde dehydrogenase [Corynebacterium sanguinis]MCT1554628.1 succinic semialdehyde dehydrogenase [Corynebacterium sanguinis]
MTHAIAPERATQDIINPATGEVVATVTAHTKEDTREAFAVARRAQKRWAKTSFRQRRKIFLKFHNLVIDNRDKIMDTIQAENGKNRLSALEEVLDVAMTARHYAYRAEKLLKPKGRRPAVPVLTSTREEYAPKGVVGAIAPFNYPLTLAVSDAIPAILAGNTVVLKPDSQTPLSALLAAELLSEAGLPDGIFNVITGRGSEVGQAITEECDYLMFTGSTETGRSLAEQVAPRLIDYSMELGGKNPLIVADDADIERAVNGIWPACFGNSGQLCISIERIYVHRKVADKFIPAFVNRVKQLKVGGGTDWNIDMGSLISAEHADLVERFVDDAVSKGATVLTGGKRLRELGDAFYAPTVLADVPESADLHRDEVFGPVVYIEVVDSNDEAVRRANDTEYGLNSSVWASPSTGKKLASRLESGTVNINEGYAPAWSAMDAPMGGWKASGVGRRHGDHGITKYTESRNVTQTRFMNVVNNGIDSQTWATTLATTLKLGRDILR